MYAVTGVTGKVGGLVARALREAGFPVRAIVRDREKGKAWADLGCEVAVADNMDKDGLTQAFAGAQGVFLMNAPNYDPAPGFPQTKAINEVAIAALRDAKPGNVVFLSTVGAHVSELSLLTNSKMTEEALRSLSIQVGLLRPAWFMENAAWDVEAARSGTISCFLQPFDHPISMIATADIGRTAAAMLRESWAGIRIVELEGPRRYSANDIAAGFSAALGRPVHLDAVPRDSWEGLFRSQGMKNPLPRMRMIDGFNEGWIDFEGRGAEHRKGDTPLESVLKGLVS
jgi:NAD(P)H dehydrogenase (quinone)